MGRRVQGSDHEGEVAQRRAASRHDALLDGGEGGVLCILDAELAVLQLCLSGGAHLGV